MYLVKILSRLLISREFLTINVTTELNVHELKQKDSVVKNNKHSKGCNEAIHEVVTEHREPDDSFYKQDYCIDGENAFELAEDELFILDHNIEGANQVNC